MIGRYVEADPVGLNEGTNHLYVYAGNKPMNFIDPLGLFDQKPPGSLGDFIPPTSLCDAPETYCSKEHRKKVKGCGFNPNAGCLEKARRWFVQCMTWADAIIYKEVKCPPCK